MRCAWCMKKFKEGKEVFGLNVTFAEGIDFSREEGLITQLHLASRNTSVPMIVVANGSEAKSEGIDGIFPVCSQKCGDKMKEAIAQEIAMFKEVNMATLK